MIFFPSILIISCFNLIIMSFGSFLALDAATFRVKKLIYQVYQKKQTCHVRQSVKCNPDLGPQSKFFQFFCSNLLSGTCV